MQENNRCILEKNVLESRQDINPGAREEKSVYAVENIALVGFHCFNNVALRKASTCWCRFQMQIACRDAIWLFCDVHRSRVLPPVKSWADEFQYGITFYFPHFPPWFVNRKLVELCIASWKRMYIKHFLASFFFHVTSQFLKLWIFRKCNIDTLVINVILCSSPITKSLSHNHRIPTIGNLFRRLQFFEYQFITYYVFVRSNFNSP